MYGPRETPKAAARQRALAVICPVRCTLTSSSTVAGRATGSARKRISPGRAVAIELKLSRSQRSRIRRAGSARAVFRLTVKRTGAKTRRATVRLRAARLSAARLELDGCSADARGWRASRTALCTTALVLGALLASASPALAADKPSCWNGEVWARPDVTRSYELYCPRTDSVQLLTGPEDSLLEDLAATVRAASRSTPAPGRRGALP